MVRQTLPRHPLRRPTSGVQALLLAVLPHGGQCSARKNAWASMSDGAVRARGRRDADLAMEQALLRSAAVARTGLAAR